MLRRISLKTLSALVLTFMLFNCTYAQSETKALYGVLIDNTGSLKNQFPQVLMLAKGIVKRVHQRGQISLFNFRKDDYFAIFAPGVSWTQDEAPLKSYLDSLSVVTGQTALLEAIDEVAEEIRVKGDSDKAFSENKSLILITDGEDRVRRAKGIVTSTQLEDEARKEYTNQLIKKLKQSGIKVYSIGLTREVNHNTPMAFGMSPREKAERFLMKISKETGGRAVIPKSKKIDIDSLLDELFAQ